MYPTGSFLVLLSFLALASAGCGPEKPERPQEPGAAAPDTTFHPPTYPAGRSVDTVLTLSLGAGRAPAYFVASSNDTASGRLGRSDLVEVFVYDPPLRRYAKLLSDSVEAATGISVQEVTGGGTPEVVVPLRQSGNDPITSNGLNVYSADDGAVRAVFRSRWMNPRLDTLSGYYGDVICLSREVWPLFATHADAETYVDDVYAYEQGLYRSVARKIPGFFRERALEQRRRFRELRDTLLPDSTTYAQQVVLFRSAALAILNFVKANAIGEARRFWNMQRAYLAVALRPEQYDELEAFVAQQLKI